MAIKFHPISGRQVKGRPSSNPRQHRTETERQRRADYARQNVASALKLKGAF